MSWSDRTKRVAREQVASKMYDALRREHRRDYATWATVWRTLTGRAAKTYDERMSA